MLIDNKYSVLFDKTNPNNIIIKEDGKLLKLVACPKTNDNSCDIIIFSEKMTSGYTTNFQGLVLFSTEKTRTLYHKGIFVDKIKRT
jgi:hypothetical protein